MRFFHQWAQVCCKFLTYVFHKVSTVKKWIFTSKELILFKWKFLKHKTQLTRSRQSFTSALDFLPKSCHCSWVRWKAVGDASQLLTAFRLAKHGQPLATPLRHPRCTADISWRGAQLQWQRLGKNSKAKVKLWRLRDNWVLCFKNFHLNRINSFEVKIHFLTVEALWKI